MNLRRARHSQCDTLEVRTLWVHQIELLLQQQDEGVVGRACCPVLSRFVLESLGLWRGAWKRLKHISESRAGFPRYLVRHCDIVLVASLH